MDFLWEKFVVYSTKAALQSPDATTESADQTVGNTRIIVSSFLIINIANTAKKKWFSGRNLLDCINSAESSSAFPLRSRFFFLISALRGFPEVLLPLQERPTSTAIWNHDHAPLSTFLQTSADLYEAWAAPSLLIFPSLFYFTSPASYPPFLRFQSAHTYAAKITSGVVAFLALTLSNDHSRVIWRHPPAES